MNAPKQTDGLERRRSALFDREFKLEMREENGQRTLAGYFGVYRSRSVDMGGWFEEIETGFFNRMVDADARVAALDGHVTNLIVASTYSGSLTIELNAKGGFHKAIPIDSPVGEHVLKSVARGDTDGMSFGFRTLSDQWHKKDGMPIRRLLDGEVPEISYTWTPAYPATSAHVRSIIQCGISEGEQFVSAMICAEKGLGLTDEQRALLEDARGKLDIYLGKNGADISQVPAQTENAAPFLDNEFSKRLKMAEILIGM